MEVTETARLFRFMTGDGQLKLSVEDRCEKKEG